MIYEYDWEATQDKHKQAMIKIVFNSSDEIQLPLSLWRMKDN